MPANTSQMRESCGDNLVARRAVARIFSASACGARSGELGRVIRDIGRRIAGNDALEGAFARELTLARRVRDQDLGQRGPKVYFLYAPEVECIGKGKAHRPYEFGVKVSVVTPLHHSRGGQFIAHVAALPGNPYDGHTLATVIPAMQALVASTLECAIADAGYRGHRRPIISSGYLPQVRSAAFHALGQTRVQASGRHRAGHRPSQGRAPHGPQSSRSPRRRCHQRRARRRRLQLPPLIQWLRFLSHRILLAFAAITQFNPA